MASRDELVRFVYDVVGDKDVAAATVTMLKAADAGKVAEADILAFADAFKTAAAQAKLADQAISQKAGIADLTAQLTAAKEGLAQLSVEFDRTDVSSRKVNAAFASAEAQVAALTRQLAAESLELQKTEGTLQKFGVDTANLATESTRLKTVANENAVALAKLGTASKEAAAGFSEIAEKSTLLSRAVEQVKALVAAFAGLFVLEKAKDAIEGILEEGDKAQKFGAQFSAAFGGVEQGAEALAKVREIAEGVPLALDDVTAAALRAKKEGLDPFDGTLTSLIDVNAKFGGSVDTLNTLIDTLGKAANKGQIDLRALSTLQQQGIPATKLLGDAMGKTADEILALAKSGQLGKDAVQTLLAALAQSGEGEAAAQLGLLSGITKKLHDDWQEFLELIANSGAYQFVQQQLQKLNASIKEGLADGSLAKAAQAISDAIVSIGRAVVGSTQFLIEHAAAIGVAVKGYVLFRATLLALDLAGAAERMLGLAAATQAAGEAAAGAAEAGGFAKLTAAIGRIPKAIQIGITVAAVDFTLTQIEKLIDASKEFYATQQKQKDIDADIAAQRDENAAKAATLTEKLKAFADAQIASADELRDKNKQQTDAYLEQLQQATRFYTALRVQQEQAGDTAGIAASTEKLRQIGEAVVTAGSHLKDLDAGLQTTSDSLRHTVDEFDRLKTSGVSAAQAISGAFKNIDIQTPQGFQAAISLIQQVSIRSREAKEAVQGELVAALEQLDAVDLANFQAKVSDRLKNTKENADALNTALGAALQANLLKLGLTAEQAGVQFTDAGEKIIAAFRGVSSNATATGQTIQVAFAQALSKLSTTGEVEALQRQLQDLFDHGKISADVFGVASEAAGRKLAAIAVDAAQAESGLDGVGKAGQDAAAKLSGSLQDARDALIAKENDLSKQLTAALQSDNAALAASLTAQIKLVATEVDGLNAKISSIDQPQISAPKIDVAPVREALKEVTDAGSAAADSLAQDEKDATQSAQGISGALGNALSAQASFLSEFAGSSANAVKRFTDVTKEFFEGAHLFSQAAITDSTGIIKFGEAIADAGRLVEGEINQQREGVAALAAQYQDFAQTATRASLGAAQNLDALKASLEGDAAAAREGRSAFDLLGAADLSALSSALDAAAAKVEQLKEQAQQAKDTLQSIGASIQDAIDQINGNQAAIENRRFQDQLKQIEDAAKLAGDLNSSEVQEEIRKAKLLHELKLKQIKDEQDAQKKNKGGPDEPSPTKPPGGGGNGGGQGGGNAPAAPAAQVTINAVLLTGDQRAVDDFTRRIRKGLNDIDNRSR